MSTENPTPSPDAPRLPDKPQGRRGLWIGLAVAAVAVVAAGAIFVPQLLNGGSANAAAEGATAQGELQKVKIGVTNASDPSWTLFTELAEKEGIDVELVNFTEYPLPNPALAAGELDVNSFQHLDYLSNHNLATGDDLQPIASTVVVPLPLYSEKWDAVEDIPEGAQIAIPNDPSNQGRGINVLAAAGLVTLKGDPLVPTPADIDESASRVAVVPVEASQTVAALQSSDGAIINNNFAKDAGLDPSTALFSVDPEDPLSWPYLNVIAVRADDVDNPVYAKLGKIWHTPEHEALVLEASGGTAVIQDVPAEELRDRLAKIEEQKAAAQ
jgi:D-methionine transport system substrate-binding protein